MNVIKSLRFSRATLCLSLRKKDICLHVSVRDMVSPNLKQGNIEHKNSVSLTCTKGKLTPEKLNNRFCSDYKELNFKI